MPGLKHATTAGEVLNPEIFRIFKERTGLELAEGYGQTETTLLMGNFAWNIPGRRLDRKNIADVQYRAQE